MPKKKHIRQRRQPGQQQQPQWQPIEMLPTLATHIDGMLESSQEQYETLLEAKPKPHVLDDYTVNRVTKALPRRPPTCGYSMSNCDVGRPRH
jgi:hypothetical protein